MSSIDLSDAYLHIPIHPNSRKCLWFGHRSQVFHFTSLPFGLATAPQFTIIYNACEGSEVDGPHKDWLIRAQSQEEAQVTHHSDSGRPDSVLRVDNKSGEIRTKAGSSVFVHGPRIPSRFSPCKTHSREMAQTSGFDPTS